MEWTANWIKPAQELGDVCPLFKKSFTLTKELVGGTLFITAQGVYEASLNGKRISDFVLAPGWTVYPKRLQYQAYDVTALLKQENSLCVTLGKGWYRSRLAGWTESAYQAELMKSPAGLLAQLELTYTDGSTELVATDASWLVSESQIRFSEIYDGESFDASFQPSAEENAACFDGPFDTLIAQQGAEIREQERVAVARIFTTPARETVLDFGQEITGYAELSLDAKRGDEVRLSHAEVLDKQGNFYTANYRSAKADYHYICKEGAQIYTPRHTFYGFRYIRIDAFPGGPEAVKAENFTAIAVHSEMKRTGTVSCSNPLLNKLFDNILWGQKGNFLDVPTDCPQRDERLGWTGDAQAFVKAACLNYDTETFFTKWLADLAAQQKDDGSVGHVIPDVLQDIPSAAWADAATICPWEVYLAYGSRPILSAQFDSMKKWVGYVTDHTTTPYLWTGGTHFGDWLGLDAEPGSYKGSSREDLIATAFYAHSTDLVIKAGHVLGEDVTEYETLYNHIVAAFRNAYPEYKTQTECVLAIQFYLAEDCQKTADQLAALVEACGVQLKTGFVGTPYLLYALSNYGYEKLAYSLLLREQYPSWLYPVTKGATTIWEHWDGIMENGDFWSDDMNSYNHYAYGAVIDWVYTVAAGIQTKEDAPGYQRVRIAPVPDSRLDWLTTSLETRNGLIRSAWEKEDGLWRYEITTPVDAEIVIGDTTHSVGKGSYLYYGEIN